MPSRASTERALPEIALHSKRSFGTVRPAHSCLSVITIAIAPGISEMPALRYRYVPRLCRTLSAPRSAAPTSEFVDREQRAGSGFETLGPIPANAAPSRCTAIMLTCIPSHFLSPLSGGAAVVYTLPHKVQRGFPVRRPPPPTAIAP
jgi:hypothetical protein